MADLLVRRGLPFREAHGVVAGLVRTAVDSGRRLSELTPEELRGAERVARRTSRGGRERRYYKVLARDSWLESKVSMGGTALPRVREQLERARATLGETPGAEVGAREACASSPTCRVIEGAACGLL